MQERLGRHNAAATSPNLVWELKGLWPSGGGLSRTLSFNQSGVRRKAANEHGLLADNVGKSPASRGTKSGYLFEIPALASPKTALNVLNCKLAVRAQFAAVNPAGSNGLRDGSSGLYHPQSSLARLRRRSTIEG
jgi:hypothetical protein